MAAQVKRDDVVVVIGGEDRGKSGRVLEVRPREDRVIVEGVNVRRKTMRRTPDNPAGGIEDRECPIHLSNVMLQDRYEAKRKQTKSAAE